MKKIFLPLLMFVVVKSFSQIPELRDRIQRLKFESPSKNDPTDISKAKIVTENIYTFPQGDSDKADSILTAVITYNVKGQITNTKEFAGKSVISKTYWYILIDTGNAYKKLITTVYNKNDTHFTEIEYNSASLETVRYDYDKDSANMRILINQYNEQGQLIAVQYLSESGEPKTAKEFFYTDKGVLNKINWLAGKKSAVYKTFHFKTTDSTGIEEVFMNDNKIASFKYSANGKCVEERVAGLSRAYSTSQRQLLMNEPEFYLKNSDPHVENDAALAREYERVQAQSFPGGGASSYSAPETNTAQHFYNANGTIAETKVVSKGSLVAVVKHYYNKSE